MTQTWVPSVREGTLRSAPCCMGVPPLGGQALCSDPITHVYNMGVDPRSVPQVLDETGPGSGPAERPPGSISMPGSGPAERPPRLFILYLTKLEADPRSVLQDSSG